MDAGTWCEAASASLSASGSCMPGSKSGLHTKASSTGCAGDVQRQRGAGEGDAKRGSVGGQGGQGVTTHLFRIGLLVPQHPLLAQQLIAQPRLLLLLSQQLIAQPRLLRLQQPRLEVRRPRVEQLPLAQLVLPNFAWVEGGPAVGSGRR